MYLYVLRTFTLSSCETLTSLGSPETDTTMSHRKRALIELHVVVVLPIPGCSKFRLGILKLLIKFLEIHVTIVVDILG
jgi:hypothetical protein